MFGVCEALDARAAAVQRAARAANLRKLDLLGRASDGVDGGDAAGGREDGGGITTVAVKLEPAAAGAVAPGAWRRSATCVTDCEVLTMSSSAFRMHVLASNKITAELAGRLGVRRARWETLRVECALHLARNSDSGTNESMAPPRITRRTMAFARYALSPEMLAPNVAKVNHRSSLQDKLSSTPCCGKGTPQVTLGGHTVQHTLLWQRGCLFSRQNFSDLMSYDWKRRPEAPVIPAGHHCPARPGVAKVHCRPFL